MKKYLNHILALIIALSGLSSCSDKDEPSPIPEEPEVNGFCLMMYISGGDMEHDLIFAESIRQDLLERFFLGLEGDRRRRAEAGINELRVELLRIF